jgi:hypothetical protein
MPGGEVVVEPGLVGRVRQPQVRHVGALRAEVPGERAERPADLPLAGDVAIECEHDPPAI